MLKTYFWMNLIVFYRKIKMEPIIDINNILCGILTNIDFHGFDLNETNT